jgi:hypothetical protein
MKKREPLSQFILRGDPTEVRPPHREHRIAGGTLFHGHERPNALRAGRAHDERDDPLIGAFLRALEAERQR